jgi:hypothetical protein
MLRYKIYIELIYNYLFNDKYIKLACIRIFYREIIYVYEKTLVTVMKVILSISPDK